MDYVCVLNISAPSSDSWRTGSDAEDPVVVSGGDYYTTKLHEGSRYGH